MQKTSKADLKFIAELENVKKQIHKRFGRKMCKELMESCIDCRIRILIAFLNDFIELLK